MRIATFGDLVFVVTSMVRDTKNTFYLRSNRLFCVGWVSYPLTCVDALRAQENG